MSTQSRASGNKQGSFQRMKRRYRITFVSSPATRASSARRDEEWLWNPSFHEEYDVKAYVFSKYRESSLEIAEIYTRGDALLWLLGLPFRLVKARPDLLITGMVYPEAMIAFIMGKILRQRSIVYDSHWYWPKSTLNHLIWPVARGIALHANIIMVLNTRTKLFWKTAGVKEERILICHVYTATVNVTTQRQAHAAEIRKCFDNKNIILFVGRLIKIKGVDYLIQAFAKLGNHLNDSVLVIVGDGPERVNLTKLSEDLRLSNVHFMGAVWDEDFKAALYLACDIFVLPSVTMDVAEEWGLAINEAMSVGKPVVTTNAVGSAFELVRQNVNGFVVPEKSIQSLSNALHVLVENDRMRSVMGERSKEIIKEEFELTKAQRDLRKIIDHARRLRPEPQRSF